MTSNFGDGFLGFQARIDAIAEALGGDAEVREWVASEFAERLRRTMATMRGCREYTLPWRIFWTMATTAEFDAGGRQAERIMGIEQYEPIEAQATWRGAQLARRGATIWLEGGGYRLIVAMASRDDGESARKGKERWRAHITDEAASASGRSYGPGCHKSANAGSRAAAIKAAERIVKAFLGVELGAPG